MAEKREKARIDLALDEIEYYFGLLKEPVTEYDCGDLCKRDNGGIPYCCVAEKAVPLLYKAEFDYLKKRGDLWFVWKPHTKEDRELLTSARKDQIFCECQGVIHCKRDQRSLTCRTFPLEPYIDRRGVFVGLTFLEDFTNKDSVTGKVKCPLTKKGKEIRQAFVDENWAYWEKLMLRLPDEYETYKESSKELRRKRTRTGVNFHLFFPTHLKQIPSSRKYLY